MKTKKLYSVNQFPTLGLGQCMFKSTITSAILLKLQNSTSWKAGASVNQKAMEYRLKPWDAQPQVTELVRVILST